MSGHWTRLGSEHRGPVTALVALGLGALFFMFTACLNGSEAAALARQGVTAEATVVQVKHHQRGAEVTVEFTGPANKTVTVECTSCSSDSSLGDRVRIRYDPRAVQDGVEDAANHGAQRVAVFALCTVVIVLGCAGLVGWRWRRDIKRRRLLDSM